MNQLHTPVMLNEILQMVHGLERPPHWGCDVTFGRGGHTQRFLREFPDVKIVAMDRDEDAVSYGQTEFEKQILSKQLTLVRGSFHNDKKISELRAQCGPDGFDFILMDLGVSSPQLDNPERGFSFYHEGPLDMRMDRAQEISAADIVNSWSERDLINLFCDYGEVRRPERVVKRIVQARKKQIFTKTTELSGLIEQTEGWHRKGFHPATRYFLALRLEVNEELSALEPSITPLIESLALGGRLMVITFHSLEDRIIKYAFKERVSLGKPVNKKVIVPTRAECLANPRARSAKLRVFQRGHST